MKFFDNQKIDDAGRTGVVLQKIILFFSALTVLGGIFGLPLSIITVTVALGIFALGFFGAYYRHSCMLKAYAIIRILELIFHFLLVAVAFVALFFIVGVLVAGVAYENYYSEPMPVYYGKPMPMMTGGVVPDMEMNDMPMMMKHGKNQQPTDGIYEPIYVDPIYVVDPIVEPGYVGGAYYIYYGWNDYVNVDIYYDYVNQLTAGEIIAFTILATVIVIASIIVSIVYYALVIYTIVLSFRMVSQIKQSAAVYAAVEQKECQLETPQPFVYVVADPTNGNQTMLLQPVDPTVFQMQNFA